MPQEKQHWIVTVAKIAGFLVFAMWVGMLIFITVTHRFTWRFGIGAALLILPVLLR